MLLLWSNQLGASDLFAAIEVVHFSEDPLLEV